MNRFSDKYTQHRHRYTQVNVEIKTQRHIHTYTSHGITIISTVQGWLFILADDVAGGCEPAPRIVKRFMFLQWSLCVGQTCSDESPEPRFCIPVDRKTQTHKHEQIFRQLHTTHSQIHSCQCWDTDAETHILRHSHRKPIIFLYWRGLFVLANDVVRSCWGVP